MAASCEDGLLDLTFDVLAVVWFEADGAVEVGIGELVVGIGGRHCGMKCGDGWWCAVLEDGADL